MIPEEVELRIARYFFHMYLPDDVMRSLEAKLLPSCIGMDEEELDHNELVRWALEIMDKQLDGKRLK
ncbi:hypothetical protein [Pseudogracilibacillus sp. SO30301A]|uniref:hypothetical protein n=1 Tax=Pseudogracilibacillus sp. SO30301A TaxID=3098291 RepID=UPI00300E4F59